MGITCFHLFFSCKGASCVQLQDALNGLTSRRHATMHTTLVLLFLRFSDHPKIVSPCVDNSYRIFRSSCSGLWGGDDDGAAQQRAAQTICGTNTEHAAQLHAAKSHRGASFAVRVHDFRLYHEVCRNVILRWMYPLVPDNATTGGVQTQYTYSRVCNYKAPGVNLPRSVRCACVYCIATLADVCCWWFC